MPSFHDTQQTLKQARLNRASERKKLFLARQQAQRIERQIQRLQRSFSANNPAQVQKLQQLQQRYQGLQGKIDALAEAYSAANSLDIQATLAFADFSDPREQIEELDDRIPILLMPLRIETRFKALQDGSETFHQLWVRVFPDDWAVDNFEQELSETELKNARLYWVNYHKAGGWEEEQRAAWRDLVANHGTGRAAYIISQYTTDPPIPATSKSNREDVALIILVEEVPPAAEQSRIAAFWSDIWKSGSDQTQLDVIWNALVDQVGLAEAERIREELAPLNLDDEPLTPYQRSEVNVHTHFLKVPSIEEWDAKVASWSQAAQAQALPDRFMLRLVSGEEVLEFKGRPIRSPLQMGPDPSAEPAEQLQKNEGKIEVPEGLRWMTDFDEAVNAGLGFRISLTNAQAQKGFDKLMVIGIRLSSDETESQEILENLIDHHHYSLTDFGLLPQGSPTNNTEGQDSAYSYRDDAEQSFDRYVRQQDQFTETEDVLEKKDGQWLAEWLGIRPEVLKRVAFAGSTDQCESRAMNSALWPATMGYTMEAMMGDVFGPNTRKITRAFFNKMVIPRGVIPAIRIGEQPYGIMPATAWSRMEWIRPRQGGDVLSHGHSTHIPATGGFLYALYQLLLKMDADWDTMLEEVSFLGKTAGNPDAHQMLLDIVGLHPSSVEFYQRYAQSAEQIYNQYNALGLGGKILAWLITGSYVQSGMNLLGNMGAKLTEPPEILTKFFLQSQNLLQGPLIDDSQLLSETLPVRAYTENGKNYLHWLQDAAASSLDTLRLQQGFTDNKRPKALLYNMLRHSLQLSYWESSIRLLSEMPDPIIGPDELIRVKKEPKFIHVQGANEVSESKFEPLYRTAPSLTNHNSLTVAEYIPTIMNTSVATEYLAEQLTALEHLKDVPTARLERAFTEHIDACSYRLDAWKQSLVNYQLSLMRFTTNPTNNQSQTRQGIYLGAYGYLEHVRSENKVLSPAQLPADLEESFAGPNDPPLLEDNTNQGFIHAPSLNHAVTAAILRNGYLSNATSDHPDTLAVNLSSERVRLAMGVMEGIRNGQSLGAMLGYQLERDLHDNHQLAETDEFIFDLRKAFPLVGNRMKRTRVSGADLSNTSIDAIEARHVVDGDRLAKYIENNGNASYPFGRTDLPSASTQQREKIDAAVDRMRNIKDAVADLAIAESVHQTVLGNYDRAAANLDAYSKGALPPVPDVVQTPRSGVTLTHRVALMLDPTAGSQAAPWPGGLSSRAVAEPAINLWLASVLPDPSIIGVQVHRSDTDAYLDPPIFVDDLEMQPLDLLFALKMDGEQAMQDLDDRILQEALNRMGSVRADVEVSIRYTVPLPNPDHISLFELAPLTQRLREVILSSKHLRATDLALHNEANDQQDSTITLDRSLVVSAILTLQDQLPALDGYIGLLGALLDDVESNRATLINNVDTHLIDYLTLCSESVPFGMTEASRAFGYDWKKTIYQQLDQQVQERLEEWNQRLQRFDDFLVDDLAAATPEERFAILQKAELEIRTTITTPLPNDPLDLRNALLAHRALFVNKRDALQALLSLPSNSISAYLTAIHGVLPLTQFDWEAFSLEAVETQILSFSGDLLNRANSLRTALDKKIQAAEALLTAHDATASVVEKVDLLQQGGKAIFGEDFVMVPQFTLDESQGTELDNANTHKSELLLYQENDLGVLYPVDEWLYGIGRVRDKLFQWEQLTMLAEGFGMADLDLEPLQLPYRENDHWLGLEYPSDYDIEQDRLLLTWLNPSGFVKSTPQCGLMIDEWTEVIPTKEETTGVTFHFDKPNSEPPQVMLLVTPTKFQQSWEWQDVVDAVEESFDMAKKRAVEPEQISKTDYPRFLPATISAVTMHPITIAMNYAVMNGLLDLDTEE